MNSLADILSQRGLDCRETSDQLAAECPLCDDYKARLYINPATGLWICHNCDERGNMLTLLERIGKYDPMEAYHVAQKIGIKRKVEPMVKQAVLPLNLPDGFTPLEGASEQRELAYWRYLRGRGLDAPAIERAHMGYTLIGKAAYRVVIPVIEGGVVKGWVARAILPKQTPKTVNAPGMESAALLYNIDNVRMSPDIVVTEGIFDALAMPDRAVATFGAKMSAVQRMKIRTLTRNVTLMWDTDEPGIKAAVKVVPELLMSGFNVRLAILREGDDPGSAGATRNAMALRNAIAVDPDWSQVKIRQVLEEGRTKGW